MSVKEVKDFLESKGLNDRVMEFDTSSATVDLAAADLGVDGDQIAKTMAFDLNGKGIVIVTSGKAKISNQKFKAYFGIRPTMIKPEKLVEVIGHPMGGVCPFCVNSDVEVYLDESLKKYEIVYPAAGSDNSAVKISVKELEAVLTATWIDACKE